MELSALTKAFHGLIDSDDLPEAVLRTLMSPEKNSVLSYYVDMMGKNLQTDELQKIFQYYYADRKEKCQDYKIGRASCRERV